ncbi:hypothetical protein HPB49_001573 [Dermacentor silvarum]|uniref:Uncharacterized protein n=1 Tax=Dermacentor silvarum TaxID=543639 RepID=A0ACB8DHP5_DERSI|nr:hypothetical protein HPB49_001573 [Dermacentor silvarum]
MPIMMDMPIAPPDQELRNIIDKLAQFVARNGPEFEQMTKQKQKDNPKFSFLFGGEYYAYYKHQVATQQSSLKPKEEVPPTAAGAPPGPMPWQATSNVALAQLQQQVQEIQEQIRQSEVNLAAQHQVLLQQQQVQLDEAIRKAQDDKLMAQAKSCDIEIAELDKILQPIIESCTKDAISLLKLWETNNYFPALILEQLKNPAISLANYQASLITEHAAVITSVTSAVQAKYTQLQKQHQDFVAHLTSRLQALQFGILPPTMAPQAGLSGVAALPTPGMLPQAALATAAGQALPTTAGLAPPTSVNAPGSQVASGIAATPATSAASQQPQQQQLAGSEQEATSQDSAITGSEAGSGGGSSGNGEDKEESQPLEVQASNSIQEMDPQLAQGHGPNMGPASLPDDIIGGGLPPLQQQHPQGPMSMNADSGPPHMMSDHMPPRDMRPGCHCFIPLGARYL